MVLNVIAREITRRFERAFIVSLPPSLSSFFHFPLSSLFSTDSLSSPEVHRYFTYSFSGCRPFAETCNASSSLFEGWYSGYHPRTWPNLPFTPPRSGGNPLWHRREPAFISHLPLFFISDIRIYHRDPAGTPLESRGDEIESRVIRIGGRGRIPLKKIERRPIIGPVGHLDRWRLSTPFNHRRE